MIINTSGLGHEMKRVEYEARSWISMALNRKRVSESLVKKTRFLGQNSEISESRDKSDNGREMMGCTTSPYHSFLSSLNEFNSSGFILGFFLLRFLV